MTRDDDDLPDAPATFLAEPIDNYIAPLVQDLATYDATLRIPTALRAALSPRYSIKDELGRGGMATVYLAFDQLLSRFVALKVLSPAVADGLGAERFIQEIEITSKLQHERIVPVHDRGEAAGLLYYVMRHFDKGSLRVGIESRGRLAVATAIAIARDIAQAVDFAHSRGIIHRDIKPENILLDGDRAYLADFGVARLIDVAGRDRLTRTGVILGTAQYMSPEQASSRGPIDGRADVYSLACVLYEMLAGEPPFTGPTPADVLAKQLAAKVPDLTIVRSVVAPAMQRVLETALRKTPADRYATAVEFIDAFEAAVTAGSDMASPLPTRKARRARRIVGLAVAVAAVASVTALVPGGRSLVQRAGVLTGFRPPPDTTRIVVYPFLYDGAFASVLRERELMADAIRRWVGYTVVDEVRLTELFERQRTRRVANPYRELAKEFNAGRFVRGEMTRIGDSIRIHAALYDRRTDRIVRDGTIRVPQTLAGLDSAAGDLVAQLLFGTVDPVIRAQCLKTAVPSAFRACSIAQTHILEWQLAAADAQLSTAIKVDAQFAYAQLWLALVRSWRHEPVARWRSAVERAVAGAATLDAHDRTVADALVSEVRGDVERSCALWETLVRRAPHSFTAWYSLGDCLRGDTAVVRDRSSPSGWRFRSSQHRALSAYQRAFELRPTALTVFEDELFRGVREMFVTARSVLRPGRSLGADGESFLGRAAWRGDSLAFIPFPRSAVREGRPETLQPNTDEAVHNQRRIFADAATSWVASNSGSAVAMEALAFALEMLIDPAAIDTLRRARSMATTDERRLRIAVHEVWLRLKFAIPDDLDGIQAARALADSLLALPRDRDGRKSQFLAGLAALTGRASLAASLVSNPSELSRSRDPAAVARAGLALVAFASLGGPSDSLRYWERQFHAAIRATLTEGAHQSARQEWSARAATLAFPDLPGDSAYQIAGDDELFDAQVAALRNEPSLALAYLRAAEHTRTGLRASDLSFDGIYPEIALLVNLGNSRQAAAWLDPMLSSLQTMAPLATADVAAAGCLVRSIVLRADIARQLGDEANARRWSAVARVLWSDADSFLRPTLQRMIALSQ